MSDAAGTRLTQPDDLGAAAPRWLPAAGLAVCLLVVGAATWRDAGTYAHTFADERTYSYYARLQPLEEAPIPSYLYLRLFSATQWCGDGALACSRLLNALFFAAALPFLFLLARRFASWRTAAVVVCVTAVGPLASYTAYFMPESMYFFGVWVFLWLLTSEWLRSGKYVWVAGATLGLVALVKLHGLFLAPSATLLVFLAGWERGRLRTAATDAGSFVGALLLVRFGVGLVLAGPPSLSVLGAVYGETAQRAPQHTVLELARGAVGALWHHAQALVALFAIPVAATLTPAPAGVPMARLRRLQVLVVLLLVPLLVITAVFSAKIAGSGPYEVSGRLHMRYYNFLLPLLILVAGAHFEHARPRGFSLRLLLPALAVLAVGIYATAVGLRSVIPVSVDCPDLQMMASAPVTFQIVAVTGSLLLATWAVRPKLGAGLYVFLALPLFTLAASYSITQEVRSTLAPTVFDTGSELARRTLGPEGIEQLEVLSPDAAGAYRALFTLNNRAGTYVHAPLGSTFERTAPRKEWLLMFGDYVLTEPHRVVLRGEGFSLVRYE